MDAEPEKASLESYEVKLNFPIEEKGPDGQVRRIDTLTFRRLKLKHARLMPPSIFRDEGKNVSPEDLLPVVQALTGLPEETVGEIDFGDLDKVGEAIVHFFEAVSQQTGKT